MKNSFTLKVAVIAVVVLLSLTAALTVPGIRSVHKGGFYYTGPENLRPEPSGATTVAVKNPDGVGELRFGDQCKVAWGDRSQVFVELGWNAVLLKKTDRSKIYDVYGTPCPVGTIYELSKLDVSNLNSNYAGLIKRDEEKKNRAAEDFRRYEQERENTRKLLSNVN